MFTYTYETRYGDYKDFDTVKISTVLDLIQDVSMRDSASCGYGIHELNDMGMAWIIQGSNLHLSKPVKTDVPIEVMTAVKNMRAATSERGCILKQNGEVVGKSIANWVAFDVERKKPARIPKGILESYPLYDFEDEFFTFKKPEIIENLTPAYKITVSNKEIDTNKHLNNQKSAELLMDALPYNFSFNNISLLYKKPAYLGEILGVCRKQTEKGFYVSVEDENENPCVVGIFETV